VDHDRRELPPGACLLQQVHDASPLQFLSVGLAAYGDAPSLTVVALSRLRRSVISDEDVRPAILSPTTSSDHTFSQFLPQAW
jgi:hypothetical protein